MSKELLLFVLNESTKEIRKGAYRQVILIFQKHVLLKIWQQDDLQINTLLIQNYRRVLYATVNFIKNLILVKRTKDNLIETMIAFAQLCCLDLKDLIDTHINLSEIDQQLIISVETFQKLRIQSVNQTDLQKNNEDIITQHKIWLNFQKEDLFNSIFTLLQYYYLYTVLFQTKQNTLVLEKIKEFTKSSIQNYKDSYWYIKLNGEYNLQIANSYLKERKFKDAIKFYESSLDDYFKLQKTVLSELEKIENENSQLLGKLNQRVSLMVVMILTLLAVTYELNSRFGRCIECLNLAHYFCRYWPYYKNVITYVENKCFEIGKKYKNYLRQEYEIMTVIHMAIPDQIINIKLAETTTVVSPSPRKNDQQSVSQGLNKDSVQQFDSNLQKSLSKSRSKFSSYRQSINSTQNQTYFSIYSKKKSSLDSIIKNSNFSQNQNQSISNFQVQRFLNNLSNSTEQFEKTENESKVKNQQNLKEIQDKIIQINQPQQQYQLTTKRNFRKNKKINYSRFDEQINQTFNHQFKDLAQQIDLIQGHLDFEEKLKNEIQTMKDLFSSKRLYRKLSLAEGKQDSYNELIILRKFKEKSLQIESQECALVGLKNKEINQAQERIQQQVSAKVPEADKTKGVQKLQNILFNHKKSLNLMETFKVSDIKKKVNILKQKIARPQNNYKALALNNLQSYLSLNQTDKDELNQAIQGKKPKLSVRNLSYLQECKDLAISTKGQSYKRPNSKSFFETVVYKISKEGKIKQKQ